MKTELVNVTPAIARGYLRHNTANRPLRPSHVENLRASFARGEYRQTHQGIAFCDDGSIADGQHRLTAISLMPDGMVFPMLVTAGLKRSEAFPVIDAVQKIRSAADVLGVDRRITEVGAFLARMFEGKVSGVTPKYVEPFIEFTRAASEDLVGFCSSSSRTWSSAPVRAAAVLSLLQGKDPDYVKLIYRALVTMDFSSMPPVVLSLYKSQQAGKVRAGNGNDIFVRCLTAFNPKRADQVKIQVKDTSSTISAVRSWLAQRIAVAPEIEAPPKKAKPVLVPTKLAVGWD